MKGALTLYMSPSDQQSFCTAPLDQKPFCIPSDQQYFYTPSDQQSFYTSFLNQKLFFCIPRLTILLYTLESNVLFHTFRSKCLLCTLGSTVLLHTRVQSDQQSFFMPESYQQSFCTTLDKFLFTEGEGTTVSCINYTVNNSVYSTNTSTCRIPIV